MNRIALAGLLAMDIPGHPIRLCDGGFKVHGGDTYRSSDDVFGTIGGVDALSEGVGDNVPALSITMLLPDGSAPGDVSQPGHQGARVVFTIAEFDPETNVITSSEVQFNGQVDQSVFTTGDQRTLQMSIVSLAERLFEGNIGNSLSPVWHKAVWPGELGHDNATGLTVPVAWGVENPGRSYAGGGGGGGSGNFWVDTFGRFVKDDLRN